MEMKHRLEAPVNCFAKTTTLPSYKNPAGQEKSDSLHVRKGVARFNFFCHRIDLFLVSSCVPELYVFLKMEQRIERRNRALVIGYLCLLPGNDICCDVLYPRSSVFSKFAHVSTYFEEELFLSLGA